ncbi:MAG: membrane protein insertase YidC [Gemmatimonadales bacterium]|nr:membrane protein insertase YidC [Gemmatimonadales bacterium]
MDRRTLLAIGLMLVVALLPALLSQNRRQGTQIAVVSDSLASDSVAGAADTAAGRPAPPVAGPLEQLPPRPVTPDTTQAGERIVTVESPLYRFRFSTRGARLVGAELKQYRTFAAGDTGNAQVIPIDSRFLEYRLVFGADTLSLAEWDFEPSSERVSVDQPGTHLRFLARRGNLTVEVTYSFAPDIYLFDVEGQLTGATGGGLALVGLGPRLALVEADSVDDFRSYSVVTKTTRTERLNFRSLDPGEVRALEGPFEWVAVKSKYFLATVLTVDPDQPRLGGAVVVGGQRSGRNATHAMVTASLPAPGGRFAFSTYVGPQDYKRLARVGHGLEDINSYGWIFRPVIQPVANFIVVVLLWMHENLNMAYGWVLILFGLAVRVVLWPLNQKAMRSSMAMQAVQPELKAVQERFKSDPQKMQQEVMKLYKEHGVNPLGGCLPMLIPMPVLFALFFVFRITIEFRGVPFLWLPDLSRADPYFIIPVVMGLSMFGVSKIGQIGVPPNPQAKMMLYVMPVFLTFIFLKLSSGLNLYYAVSNIASIPQQWMIAQQRLRKLGKRE